MITKTEIKKVVEMSFSFVSMSDTFIMYLFDKLVFSCTKFHKKTMFIKKILRSSNKNDQK